MENAMETYPIPGFAEPASSLTHLLGAGVFAAVGFRLLQRARGDGARLVALGIFVVAVIFSLSMSGVYHLLEARGTGHAVLQRLDHAGIFALIAGSFTPVHGLLFTGWGRWGVLVLMWTLAITGITLKATFFEQIPEALSLGLYLGMGWMGLASGIALWRRYGFRLVRPLIFSGLAYSAGAILEFLRLPVLIPGVMGPHELFHLAVLAGVGFHFRFLFRALDLTVPLQS
jgi:channel protein (hemolysin III family)